MMRALLLTLLFLGSSCSLLQKGGLRASGPVIYQGTYEGELESNWEMFKAGVPANLKLLESLLFSDQNNLNFLAALVKGYAGHAFIVHETEHYEKMLQGEEQSNERGQAIRNYEKALTYAQRYLELRGIEGASLREASQDKAKLSNLFSQELSKNDTRDLEVVFFTAQSLGGLLNLQKSNMKLMGQVTLIKALMDWVCQNNPEINHGACSIFYGAFESSRPKMLGGNPDKSKKIFKEAISRYPDNLLVRVSYLQYYVLPLSDEEAYKEEKDFLNKAFRPREFRWPYEVQQKENPLNLYNEVAKIRFEFIKKYEKNLF